MSPAEDDPFAVGCTEEHPQSKAAMKQGASTAEYVSSRRMHGQSRRERRMQALSLTEADVTVFTSPG